MSAFGQRLFDLMPAFYRLKDAALAQSLNPLSPADQATLQVLEAKQAAGVPLTPSEQLLLNQLLAKTRGPLQSLLMLIAEQLAIVSNDLDQLYDDQFIETCAPWVIPYIGDLIGYRTVKGSAPSVASPRAEVAHTISFRRRKGTVLLLEELARDVTGWGAHAVEMFKLLGDTQYMNHIRLFNDYAPDLRRWQAGAYMNTGFDRTAHKVDVRRIAVERGRYNIQNIAVFLWSLNAYSVTDAPLAPVPGNSQCFRFSSLGCDMPLFNHPVPLPQPVAKSPDITGPAEPANVADRLSRNALCDDIQNAREVYYGLGQSLALTIDGAFQSSIRVCDLSGQDGSWTNMPGVGDPPSIDPELGRVALPAPPTKSITASFYYGFNADMGGGEYPRAPSFPSPAQQPVVRIAGMSSPTAIQDALNSLNGDGVVEIADSGTYNVSGGLNIQVPDDARIQLRAADGCRPTLNLGGVISATGGKDSTVYLNGLLIAYTGSASPPPPLIHVPKTRNQLSKLELAHCTLVPGLGLQPSKDPASPGSPVPAFPGAPVLVVEASGVQVTIGQSIVGAMWISLEATASLTDSIVDSADRGTNKTGISGVAYVASVDAGGKPSPGGAMTMNGCTVVGKVYASLLSLVSDCIIWAELSNADLAQTPPLWQAALWSARKQQGCVRFSYIPAGSVVPRQFQCVERAGGVPQPLFYSLRYNDPGYAKLWPGTDDLIRRGADDGGEMGAFHFVQAPSRETDLRVRMQEYLPVGLEFGVFYEN
jgi:hypothetical protein